MPTRFLPLGTWRADLPASIVVALVALPLCLGVALASGAPLFSGLIAGIVAAGIVVLYEIDQGVLVPRRLRGGGRP